MQSFSCYDSAAPKIQLKYFSGVRDAPISRHDFRGRKVSGSNVRFDRSFERGEQLLVSRYQLRVKTNNSLVASTAPGEASDKRHETFAATLRPGVNAEAVSNVVAPS